MRRFLPTLLLAAWLVLVLPIAVQADVAPPLQPPGFNPAPGAELTQVRMLSETVTVEVMDVDPPQAHFNADFTLRNLGGNAESMAVRFPIAVNDGWFNLVEIRNFEVRVAGQTVPFERIQGPEPLYGFEDESVPWAAFDVTFPPGEDVLISVAYDLDGTGYEGETNTRFYYILSTGAGWKGSIGSGEIILRLPYDANPQNVILSEYQDAPEFSGRDVIWSFSELEPTTGDNLAFEIVKPQVWDSILAGLKAVGRNGNDGQAYGRLGQAYSQALFASTKGYPRTDAGASPLYAWSRQAYERAVSLEPQDGPIHASYAELLLDFHYWQYFQDTTYTADLHRGLQELEQANRLAPDDPLVQELIERYAYDYRDYIVVNEDGSVSFPLLDQMSPVYPGADDLLQAPMPTYTQAVTPTSEPEPGRGIPFCGGAALLVLPLGMITWRARRVGG
jgi:hypothetical protein